jgi:hypothetical protein
MLISVAPVLYGVVDLPSRHRRRPGGEGQQPSLTRFRREASHISSVESMPPESVNPIERHRVGAGERHGHHARNVSIHAARLTRRCAREAPRRFPL